MLASVLQRYEAMLVSAQDKEGVQNMIDSYALAQSHPSDADLQALAYIVCKLM